MDFIISYQSSYNFIIKFCLLIFFVNSQRPALLIFYFLLIIIFHFMQTLASNETAGSIHSSDVRSAKMSSQGPRARNKLSYHEKYQQIYGEVKQQKIYDLKTTVEDSRRRNSDIESNKMSLTLKNHDAKSFEYVKKSPSNAYFSENRSRQNSNHYYLSDDFYSSLGSLDSQCAPIILKKIPQMLVQCCNCKQQQYVPGNSKVYECFNCQEQNECYTSYGCFICYYCRNKIYYPYGISSLVRCTLCSGLNEVALVGKDWLEQEQIQTEL